MQRTRHFSFSSSLIWFLFISFAFLTTACAEPPPAITTNREPVTVNVSIDGTSQAFTTESTTVRELLEEADITIAETDEVIPPLFTPLELNMQINIVRISESVETVLKTVPFEISIVRSDAMNAEDPPVIVQGGKAGLVEETVRIVYRDGIESERWVTQVTEIESAQDEIRMVGIGAIRGNVEFVGLLAFRSGGAAVVLRGNTVVPEQLAIDGVLDGRIFSLSPTGQYLLYSTSTNENGFGNNLWLISTERGARPRNLGVENVLWADWNPAQTDPPQIAYSTANPTNLPPGWEARNDLWRGNIPSSEFAVFNPTLLINGYAASYSWWGGNYVWSPNGQFIAYSYADEVGVIDLTPNDEQQPHIRLHEFADYNTLSDWVWVPTLTWSPDGRFLAYTNHNSPDTTEQKFDSWLLDTLTGATGKVSEDTGMWGHMHWSTVGGTPFTDTVPISYTIPITEPVANSQIAFLKATDPLDSQRSPYVLWLMDKDGSNGRRIYPEVGENALFPRDQYFMDWSPDGRFIAFIFNQTLHLYNVVNSEVTQVTQDDSAATQPSWAPYGAGKLRTANNETPTTTPPGITLEEFLSEE